MKVSWDDDIPNIWKNKFMFQTTNQFSIIVLILESPSEFNDLKKFIHHPIKNTAKFRYTAYVQTHPSGKLWKPWLCKVR